MGEGIYDEGGAYEKQVEALQVRMAMGSKHENTCPSHLESMMCHMASYVVSNMILLC